jgi:threonine/homoserine/homoserine lactone efflux protein
MTNPKVGLFFIAVLPQFVPHGESALVTTMILGATLSLVIFLYLAGLALIADRANAWLNRPRVTKAIEGTSGGILVALGIGTTVTAFEFGE